MVADTKPWPKDHHAAATLSSSTSSPSQSASCATEIISAPGNTSTINTVSRRVTETTQAAYNYDIVSLRPWSELVDSRAFEKPESVGEASERMKKNWGYFRANYVLCTLILIALGCLLRWRPASLIVLGVMGMPWAYFYFCRSGRLVVVLNRPLGNRCVTRLLGIATIVALFFSGAGSALTCPLALGLLLTCIHAMLRRPDDLFLEEMNR